MANIIITGANQGIGYYFAEQALKDGSRVAVLDIETDNLKGLAKAFPKQLLCCKADVCDDIQINTAVKEGFRVTRKYLPIRRHSPIQGLCRLFLFISFFLFCLWLVRQMDFYHEVKDNIHFLKTLAVYLLRCMDYNFLHKFIDNRRR